MRLTEITNTGLVDRLSNSTDFPFPCPRCHARTTRLHSESLIIRTKAGYDLQPGAMHMECEACAWVLDAANVIYRGWVATA